VTSVKLVYTWIWRWQYDFLLLWCFY